MKHTDFYSLVKNIKHKEQEELCKALEAHGGSYSWWDDSKSCFMENVQYPIIAVNVDCTFPNPTDVEIKSISVKDGWLNFVGEDKNSGELVDFCADDIFAGQIEYIIDLIPDTDAVNDVTTSM